MSDDKTKLLTWGLSTLAVIVSLASGFVGYHAGFASKQDINAGVGAVFLFLKSQNQNIKNHYLENIEEGVMVEESKRQLPRLKYEEQYIDNVQQALGVKPPKEG